MGLPLLPQLNSGFGFYQSEGSGKRSLYLALRLSDALSTSAWSSARTFAKGLGGDLAVIDNPEEQRFIRQVLIDLDRLDASDSRHQAIRNYYIGLSNPYPDSTTPYWQWTTGTLVPTPAGSQSYGYSNWADGQPDNGFGGQDKGVLWGLDSLQLENGEIQRTARQGEALFQWDDVGPANISRGDITHAIAEIPFRLNGNTLYGLVPAKSFTEAKDKATLLGGNLAQITDNTEKTYLQTFLKDGEAAWLYAGDTSSGPSRLGSDGILVDGIPSEAEAPSVALVEINTPVPSPAPPAIYIQDVIWPEAKSYAWNDKVFLEVKLSDRLPLLYKGKPLAEFFSGSSQGSWPWSLPFIVSYRMRKEGSPPEQYYLGIKSSFVEISGEANSKWPSDSIKVAFNAKDLKPSSSDTATADVILAIDSIELDLDGVDNNEDRWSFTDFSLSSPVQLDLTIPASDREC